jgi:hypothetical protein
VAISTSSRFGVKNGVFQQALINSTIDPKQLLLSPESSEKDLLALSGFDILLRANQWVQFLGFHLGYQTRYQFWL